MQRQLEGDGATRMKAPHELLKSALKQMSEEALSPEDELRRAMLVLALVDSIVGRLTDPDPAQVRPHVLGLWGIIVSKVILRALSILLNHYPVFSGRLGCSRRGFVIFDASLALRTAACKGPK